MAVLTDAIRRLLWAAYMGEVSSDEERMPLNKADLRAIFNAIDQWIDDNKTSFNNAIPEPGKTRLTSKQKSRILSLIVLKRWEVE